MSVFFIYTFNHAVRVKSFQNEKREKKERERNRDGKKKKKVSSEKYKCKHILE